MSYALIRQAILEKKAIYATYSGLHREMCPHVIGTKNGKPQALFYQYGGESSSRPIQPDGSPDNWRCIEIAKLSNVQIADVGIWHTAPDHSRPQTCVGDVDVAVAY
jgi:hypothetical protein